MIHNRHFLFLPLLLSFCISCGGGGGGSGSSSDSTGVRLLHSSIDSVPLEILENGQTESLLQGAFLEDSGRRGVGKGERTFLIQEKGTGKVIGSISKETTGDESFSAFVAGSNGNGNLKVTLLSDSFLVPDDQASVRVVHGIDEAGGISATIGGTSVATSFRGSSPSLLMAPGSHTLNVRVTESQQTILSQGVSLSAGKRYTILLGGEKDYFVMAKVIEE
jgi:hypothetical protein